MKFECRDLSFLWPVFASLWAMALCMPRMSRDSCLREAILAQRSANHLELSLRRLHDLYQNENIYASDKHVCVPEDCNSVEWSMQLDREAHKLCQYKFCLERVEKALDTFDAYPSMKKELAAANKHLDNLLANLKKMKGSFHPPRCLPHEEEMTSRWHEVSNGHRLAHRLLEDLKHLTIKSLCE